MAVYRSNIDFFKNYTIFVFDNNITKSINQRPPKDITSKLNTVKVVSAFNQSFCILNEKIFYEMSHGMPANFLYKYCYNLDVNLMNILVNYHSGKKELENIILDLKLFENDITCYPYIIENAGKLEDEHIEKCVVQTLLVFNKFIRSPTLNLFSVESPYINSDFENVKETIDLMKKTSSDHEAFIYLTMQKDIYALLLKAAIISFKKDQNVKCKLNSIMSFINNNLGKFPEREAILCCLFLKNHNDSRVKNFFRGIQCNSKKILKTIKGMSWDLFHLRYCIEFGMANDLNYNNIYLHYLITQDSGFTDVANAYPLKYLIYKKGSLYPIVIFDQSVMDEITEIDVLSVILENSHNRHQVLLNRNIDKLITSLEAELSNICNR